MQQFSHKVVVSAFAVLRHFELDAYVQSYINDSDGLTLLALLCNAGAKGFCGRPADTTLYAHKAALVTAACRMADSSRWWCDQHDAKAVYFIETDYVGQVSFHFRLEDEQPDLPNVPESNGRCWCGVGKQEKAEEIARTWLATRRH